MGNKQPYTIRPTMVFCFTFLFSGLLMIFGYVNSVYATDVIDEFSVEVPESCSLSSTIDTVHDTNIKVGQYRDDIGETTFNVFCNDAEGFSVYSVGYSGNSYGNTVMLPTNNALENAIATGLASSGEISNWAMKLTSVSENFTLFNGFGSYHVVPEEYTKVASYPSNTTATTGVQIKSTYATYISSAQVADTYTGKVKYTVVHPSNADAPARDMQNLPAAACTSTPSQVTDTRDGHTYTIQRLLDGNCWMMENLDLGRTDLTTDLTSTNTNLETAITASTFNTWIKTVNTNSYGTTVIPLTTLNTTDGLDADPISGVPYGSLYNIESATGGTSFVFTSDGDNVQYDICPAGWRLPTKDEYGTLRSIPEYNSSEKMQKTIADGGPQFTLSGIAGINNTPTSQQERGYYWTSTRLNSTRAYALSINASNVDVLNLEAAVAISIRCIAK